MHPESWYWQKTWSDFRRGSISIVMAWDGGEARIAIYDEGVPKTAQAFLARLPLVLPMVHVAWSGDMLMGAQSIPIGTKEAENLTRLVRPGDLAYDPKYDEITVTYGTAEARLPSGPNTLTVFGTVATGLDTFARWARARRLRLNSLTDWPLAFSRRSNAGATYGFSTLPRSPWIASRDAILTWYCLPALPPSGQEPPIRDSDNQTTCVFCVP